MTDNNIMEIKAVFSDYSIWDDIIDLNAKRFFGKNHVYPNILLASEYTHTQIDLKAIRHSERIYNQKGGALKKAKKTFGGLNSFNGKNYTVEFCIENNLSEGEFVLLFDYDETSDDYGKQTIMNEWGEEDEYYAEIESQDHSDRLNIIKVSGKGFGFANKNGEIIVQPKYFEARNYANGFAPVLAWDNENDRKRWIFIDEKGAEYSFEKEYQDVCENVEGFFRVSDMDTNLDLSGGIHEYWEFEKRPYNHEYTGNWGYADTKGKEIIKPQYVIAYDFTKGLAKVCKGKWEWKETVRNGHKISGYETAEEVWVLIDTTGKEIVSCKHDSPLLRCIIQRWIKWTKKT